MANTNLRNFGFSSPLGDGLVHKHKFVCDMVSRFSSPLGDGVVHHAYQTTKRTVAFSSPVGDWWFNVEQIKDTCLTKFSSPPGDGLVPLKKSTKGKIEHIFVPEWGWAGSTKKDLLSYNNSKFSSPSGDGLVLS